MYVIPAYDDKEYTNHTKWIDKKYLFGNYVHATSPLIQTLCTSEKDLSPNSGLYATIDNLAVSFRILLYVLHV